jgi:3-oxoacyl-[acyl-carrier protein] reductase
MRVGLVPSDGRPAAVVTGSTSGIGLALARRLLAEGYQVTLNYAGDDARAGAALGQCLRDAPGAAQLVKADVSAPAGAARLISEAVRSHGRLDVLVNNAARVIDKPALDVTADDWDIVADVTVKGALFCAQHAARQMLAQDSGGAIINIGAATGIRARRNGIATCASKAALMIMTQCLALELAPAIRVNTVIPGLVVTSETTRRFGLDDPAALRARQDAVPMGRLGTPDDVADAVMLLLSPAARFITGQKLTADGGQNMH